MRYFLKICGSLFYDFLSVLVLVYFASFLPVVLLDRSIEAGNILMQLFVIIIAVSYFFYCFKKGQTFGMSVWRLRLESEDGRNISNAQIFIRILTAIFSFILFGIGYIYILFNKEAQSFHDITSRTRLKEKPVKTSKK